MNSVEAVVADLGTPEYRYRWWCQLEREQPFVAARLVERWPADYPVKRPLKETA